MNYKRRKRNIKPETGRKRNIKSETGRKRNIKSGQEASETKTKRHKKIQNRKTWGPEKTETERQKACKIKEQT